ncbi:hypothetical protein BJG93_24520 [Paraburkholderia sprentiae WSM5005]|uniref:Uncharacterized protein n=1 Tax=Paraburkholderia sprentiae WSM5005 TaxID=754502 RepID=A0A1I9YQP3_9BURK|nr:hypothetical protein [Paraburkholderia sprentiae]APA88516.2 hypothetical protein BJG93_24520 [Paraburkholderia sprentiae WSM5005]
MGEWYSFEGKPYLTWPRGCDVCAPLAIWAVHGIAPDPFMRRGAFYHSAAYLSAKASTLRALKRLVQRGLLTVPLEGFYLLTGAGIDVGAACEFAPAGLDIALDVFCVRPGERRSLDRVRDLLALSLPAHAIEWLDRIPTWRRPDAIDRYGMSEWRSDWPNANRKIKFPRITVSASRERQLLVRIADSGPAEFRTRIAVSNVAGMSTLVDTDNRYRDGGPS